MQPRPLPHGGASIPFPSHDQKNEEREFRDTQTEVLDKQFPSYQNSRENWNQGYAERGLGRTVDGPNVCLYVLHGRSIVNASILVEYNCL